MGRITDDLVADHARLHALLQRAKGPPFDDAAFEELRRGLLRHIAIEEKILFPAAREARGGDAFEWARALRIDHGALTSLMVPTPDTALCAEIDGLLATHDAKEEGEAGIYAECERLLTPEVSAELARRAAEYPPPRVAAHYDGRGAIRTAAEALEAAARMKPPR